MTSYNLVMVFNQMEDKVLMCKRIKPPYEGLFNLVGGKIDQNESFLDSAYRELFEETGITKNDIILHPLMDFVWHPIDMDMKVFVGTLNKELQLVEEIHPLYWIDVHENFFDMNKYAGEGNIGHMMEIYNQIKGKLI